MSPKLADTVNSPPIKGLSEFLGPGEDSKLADTVNPPPIKGLSEFAPSEGMDGGVTIHRTIVMIWHVYSSIHQIGYVYADASSYCDLDQFPPRPVPRLPPLACAAQRAVHLPGRVPVSARPATSPAELS